MLFQPTPSEYDELLQLWEASVRSTHHFLKEEDIQFYKPLIRNQYLFAVELFAIRNKQNEIAAFMGLSDELIEMLFVHPDEQGKGYGKELIDYATKEKQLTKVDVNEQNEKALRFYLNRGFDVTGRDATDSLDKPFPILHLTKVPALANLFLNRIHKEEIDAIYYIIRYNSHRREELFALTTDQDLKTSYQALWACTHLSVSEKKWLQTKQEQLINEAIVCPHSGKRRLLLQLLEKQSFANEPRVDFLDFCLKHMVSMQEPAGIKSLCIKLAYKLCQPIPELMQEFNLIVETMKEQPSSPAISSSIRNLKKKGKGKN